MQTGERALAQLLLNSLEQKKKEKIVCGPNVSTVNAFYYIKENEAYIELAAASGLSQARLEKDFPLKATTFGTGELIKDAIKQGAEKIYLFLGGSATSDGGVGIAKALGAKFFNCAGEEMQSADLFIERPKDFPGENLAEIASFSFEKPPKCSFRTIVDVKNPLCGKNGAAYIYGPQKGIRTKDLAKLDSALENLSKVCDKELAFKPGSGAAGGSAYGAMFFLNSELVSGPKFFLDLINFDSKLEESDLVITGEGQVDKQSTQGKLLAELVKRSKNKQIISLCGTSTLDKKEASKYEHLEIYELGNTDAKKITDKVSFLVT